MKKNKFKSYLRRMIFPEDPFTTPKPKETIPYICQPKSYPEKIAEDTKPPTNILPLFAPLKNENTNPTITSPENENKEENPKLMPVVRQLMENVLSKNDKELDTEKIEPFSDEVLLGTNGVILFIGKQSSGKSYKIMSFILYTDMLSPNKPYFNNILFSSTSDQNDKTVDAFKKVVKTKIEFVKHDDILKRLAIHLKHKKKLNAIMKYVQSKGEIVPKLMKELAIKHQLSTLELTKNYIKHKLERYGNPIFPAFTLLILDDFLGSSLLERKGDELVKLLTKCRHYQTTCIIAQQSTKGIGKTVRRLASDCVIWAGFGREDFIDLCKEFSTGGYDLKQLYEVYSKLRGHSNMSIHNHLNRIIVEEVD
ncbi:MAG: hypothetical protein LBR15_00595 [Methanobrevibacter sp.]|jgi:hypothetical protein|nr:hypothetical protein [Candidatus Methanovirga australis]